jgi:hypothetical protein
MMKTGRKLPAKRGMQDVFLFHKNLVPVRQGLFTVAAKSLIFPMEKDLRP